MIPLVKKWFNDLFFDASSAAKLLRSTALFAGGMAVNVLAFPWPIVQAWTFQEWAYRVGAAGALGFAGTLGAGQKNLTPEEIQAQIAALPPKDPP